MMWHDPGWTWGWGGWLAMILMMLLFWGALVVLVVWAIRQFRAAPEQAPTPEADRPSTAIAILEERFARGEIDEQEFERRRAHLLGGAPPPTPQDR